MINPQLVVAIVATAAALTCLVIVILHARSMEKTDFLQNHYDDLGKL